MTSQTAITRSSEILGGTPVFQGTRVPGRTLIDYLESGDSLAESDYEAFLTAGQNLHYQQNLTDFAIAELVLSAKSRRLQDLEPLIPQILSALLEVQPGEVRRIAL